MAETLSEVEVFVLIDQDGDWVVAVDQDAAGEAYEETYGTNGSARRLVRVVLTVALPEAVVVRGVVPAEQIGEPTLSVCEE